MKYIIKKIFILLITLFLISIVTFSAFHIIPGDPALLMLGTEASDEQILRLHEQLGLDNPLYVQYLNWIKGLFHGDMGTSIRYQKPVAELLSGRVSVTMILGCMSIILIMALGIPLGIFSAKKNDRLITNIIMMLGVSVPNFYLSIIIIWVFGLVLHLFTPGRYVGFSENPVLFMRYMIFPVLTIAIPEISILAKYVRTAVLTEKKCGYVRTARSKGNKESGVLFGHILKNAIVAVVPLIGMIAGSVFSGSIIVEQVFGISGIGRLLISSVTSRDFPLTQTLVLYIAVIVVTINFFVDVIVQLIDPRIRMKQ